MHSTSPRAPSARTLSPLIAALIAACALAVCAPAAARRMMPKTTPEQARVVITTWSDTIPVEGVTWTGELRPEAVGFSGYRHSTERASAPNDPDTHFIYTLQHSNGVLTVELFFSVPLGPDDSLSAARVRFSHATVSGVPVDGLPWVAPWSASPRLSDAPVAVQLIDLKDGVISLDLKAQATGLTATNAHCRPPQPDPLPPHCAFSIDHSFPVTLHITAPLFSPLTPASDPPDFGVKPYGNIQ